MDSSSSVNPFSAVLSAHIEKAPRKLSPFHQYFKTYYKSRIKSEYCHRFAIAKKEYEDATEEELQSGAVEKTVAVTYRTAVGKEFWQLKTEEFRAEVAQIAEDAHAKGLRNGRRRRTCQKRLRNSTSMSCCGILSTSNPNYIGSLHSLGSSSIQLQKRSQPDAGGCVYLYYRACG